LLDELEGWHVLGDLKLLQGSLLIESKAAHLSYHVLQEPGVLGAPWHGLCCPLTLVKARGCCGRRATTMPNSGISTPHCFLFFSFFFFFLVVLGLELRAFTLSHSINPIVVKGFSR
jgi:hypothetical protein